jgi:hypothetical protein
MRDSEILAKLSHKNRCFVRITFKREKNFNENSQSYFKHISEMEIEYVLHRWKQKYCQIN